MFSVLLWKLVKRVGFCISIGKLKPVIPPRDGSIYSRVESVTLSKCACVHAKSLQLCLTLCDPMDYSLLGFSVPGILQARVLEWVAIHSSRGSSQPRD